MDIVTVDTKSLGDRSYLIVDGEAAAVVDPQRDIDRILALVSERSLEVRLVLETHLHNDYVTGGFELACLVDAQYVLPAGDDVSFDRLAAADGDEFALGDHVVIRAVHTPGHTPHHLSCVALVDAEPAAVFTGGSMLYGTVGRTDLVSEDTTDALTRAQFRSVRRLATELPESATVHPTHGFGSFCSSSSTSGADQSTIAYERRSNIACTAEDEDDFVAELLAGLTAYPRYYAHMARRNRQGPAPIDLSPPERVDPAELRRRIHSGEWVVDLRDRKAFARSHLAGTINVEIGDNFATYVGWTLRWGTPVTLVGDTADDVAEAQRQLARIGIDRPAGAATGGPTEWADGGDLRAYRGATFHDLAHARTAAALTVLDVRRGDEWRTGHLRGALHIPLDQLEARINEVPAHRPVWVHCGSGFRASIAASLLDRAGLDVVAIHDDLSRAERDLSIERDS